MLIESYDWQADSRLHGIRLVEVLMRKTVFISHSSKDASLAQETCEYLEADGIFCWIAPRDVPEGEGWAKHIVSALKNCEIVVLLLSKNSNSSEDVLREILLANTDQIPIIPVQIENGVPTGDLEFQISTTQYLDARTGAFNEHLQRLASVVRKGNTATSPFLQSRESTLDSDAIVAEAITGIEWRLAEIEHSSEILQCSQLDGVIEYAMDSSRQLFEIDDWSACEQIYRKVADGLLKILQSATHLQLIKSDFEIELLRLHLGNKVGNETKTGPEQDVLGLQQLFLKFLDRSLYSEAGRFTGNIVYGVLFLLAIISVCSVGLAYYSKSTTLTWAMRYGYSHDTNIYTGFYLEAARGIGLALLLIYVFLALFRAEFYQLFLDWSLVSLRRPRVIACRTFAALLFIFSIWTTLDHTTKNAPATQHVWAKQKLEEFEVGNDKVGNWNGKFIKERWPDITEQLNRESDINFQGNANTYRMYTPYCLVNYSFYGVTLISVILFAILLDARRLFITQASFLKILPNQRLTQNRIDSEFIKFFENCFRHTQRYLTLLLLISGMIVFESLVTRKTLSESGWRFELLTSATILLAATIWVVILIHYYESVFQKCRTEKRRRQLLSSNWEEKWSTSQFLSKCFMNVKSGIAVVLNLIPFLLFFLSKT